jgi:DNA-directed RNA polymerase specialized sigma24 family protein
VGGEDVFAALPEVYAEALRLRDRGVAAADIAARIDIPVEALETLICLAEAKLARLRAAKLYLPSDS